MFHPHSRGWNFTQKCEQQEISIIGDYFRVYSTKLTIIHIYFSIILYMYMSIGKNQEARIMETPS